MSRLGDALNKLELRKSNLMMLIYGTPCTKIEERSWYNPFRYILGKKKIKCIKPDKILIQRARNIMEEILDE